MLSNQVLQATIVGLKKIIQKDICILERNGKVCACTNTSSIGRIVDNLDGFINSKAESQMLKGEQYFKVVDNGTCEYIVLIEGEDQDAYNMGRIVAFQIQSLLVAYKERYDKDNFFKNLLLDNLLLVDIYRRAKKLHIDNTLVRIVYLIESPTDANTYEILKNMFPNKAKDFLTSVDEKNIVLIKELKENYSDKKIEETANVILDTLTSENLKDCYVSIGMPVTDLKSISNSYKEAKMALEVGKIFDEGKKVSNYKKLGIGRLIYQLPNSLCHMFIDEVLQDIKIEQFDEETLTTAIKFFENNLNVSETSRKLYIHRNTLVYRLDKLQKMIGIDLRNFDDAIIFKITLMVSKYLKYKNESIR